MTTNDDGIKWVVGRLQALQQEHEEARRADRVVDHAACRIASESCLQELLRAYDRLDEARAEIEGLQVELQRAHDAKSQQRMALEYHGLAERFPFGYDAIDRVCDALLGAEEQVERLKAERDAAYRAGADAMLSRVVEALEDRILVHEATWQDVTQDQEDRNEAMVRVSEARMCWHTVRALDVQNEDK